MSEMSGDEKENEVIPDTNSEATKEKPDVDEAFARLMRKHGDKKSEEGEDSSN